jgi:hypothetical protein
MKNWFLKSAESADEKLKSFAESVEFKTTKKKPLNYVFYQIINGDVSKMPPLSYGVNDKDQNIIVTQFPDEDEEETQNTAMNGDIIVSGPANEKYAVKKEKFKKNYSGEIGERVSPEKSTRMAARYTGQEEIMFTAPWGEKMILKPGDYIIKEDENKYYRIKRKMFDLTYESV